MVKGEILSNTNLAIDASLSKKTNDVKGEIRDITNLATTTALTAVENNLRNVSNFIKKLTKT